MKRSGILAAGNWIVDHVKLIDEFPKQDALVSISSQSKSNGGGPYNVLKDLSLLGAGFPLAGAGLVGDDADGEWILADCNTNGIDCSQLKRSAAPTSYTDVMTVVGDGRRTFFHQRGANALFDGADVSFAEQPKIFYLGYLLLLDALDEVQADGSTRAVELLARATEAGCKTAVDLVSAQGGEFSKVVKPALSEVDYLFLNEYEAGALLERSLESGDFEGIGEAAIELLEMGVREVVAIHTAEGAMVASMESCNWMGSLKLPEEKIAGTVGAGDAFAAGMLLGLHEEVALEVCLSQAICASAMCLLDPTTSGGMGSMKEAMELEEAYGFREPD